MKRRPLVAPISGLFGTAVLMLGGPGVAIFSVNRVGVLGVALGIAAVAAIGDAQEWREFRPRPNTLSCRAMAARLFFNSHWNETLYAVSSAERICEAQSDHSVSEIFDLIRADVIRSGEQARFVCFRIALVTRRGDAMVREIAFQSHVREFAA